MYDPAVDMENHHVVVLIVEDQPPTARPLVRALSARGYRVIVTYTVHDLLACKDTRVPRCPVVYGSTPSVPDTSTVFHTHRCWGTRAPVVPIAPAPVAFRRAVQERGGIVLPLFTSVVALCQAVEVAAHHEQEKRR